MLLHCGFIYFLLPYKGETKRRPLLQADPPIPNVLQQKPSSTAGYFSLERNVPQMATTGNPSPLVPFSPEYSFPQVSPTESPPLLVAENLPLHFPLMGGQSGLPHRAQLFPLTNPTSFEMLQQGLPSSAVPCSPEGNVPEVTIMGSPTSLEASPHAIQPFGAVPFMGDQPTFSPPSTECFLSSEDLDTVENLFEEWTAGMKASHSPKLLNFLSLYFF